MNRARKIAIVFVAVVGGYTAVANLLHRVVFPQAPPDPSTFPQVGDTFGSRAEGLRTTVTAVENGWVKLRMEVDPGAPGPPLHVHHTFTETFAVESGTMHLELAGGVLQLGPGEVHVIEPGTPHRPFNPTDEAVVAGGDVLVMPQSFAAALVQVYHFLDEAEGEIGPGMMLRIAAMDPIFDSVLPDVPAPAQGFVKWFLVPTARLFGYRNYYPELSLHPTTQRASG